MSFWVAGAVLVGSIGSAVIGSKAAKDASKAGQNAAASEWEYLRNRDLQARSDNQSYRKSGYDALNAMNVMTGQERQLSGEQSDEIDDLIDDLWSDFDKDGTYGLTEEQQSEVDAIPLPGYQGGGILDGLKQRKIQGEERETLTRQFKSENKLAYGDISKEDFYADKRAEMLGDPYEWKEDPGYQFRLDEGNKYLQQRQAAGGGYNSGAAIKGGVEYNQNAASDEFGKIYGRLAQIAGFGPGAIMASQGQGGGDAAIARGGAYQAAGAVAQGNAWGNAASSIAGAAGDIYQGFNQPAKATIAQPNYNWANDPQYKV